MYVTGSVLFEVMSIIISEHVCYYAQKSSELNSMYLDNVCIYSGGL